MIPQAFDQYTDVCALASKWGISPELASRIVWMSGRIAGGLTIYSGARTEAQQNQLRSEGRPTAANNLSTHLACPATGADVRMSIGGANYIPEEKWQFGTAARIAGLRWGGSDDPTRDARGIPSDWNHLDLGRRAQDPS